jgi:predicted DNA-binding transcriptional regulator AlpA
MEHDSLVDADTLAKKLGQATSSIYRLAKSGAIPSFKAGPRDRGLRFDLQEVKEALRRPAKEQAQ